MSLSIHQFGDLIPKLEKRHNDSFSDSVAAFALGTPGDPMAEFSDPSELPVTRGRIALSDLPDWGTNPSNPRVRHAQEGYSTSGGVPPILVVKRGDTYDIADGHHRVRAARNINKESLPAWVVHSPLKEPHPGFDY